MRGGDCHLERARIGVPHVLGREDDHAPRDEARVLARLEHRREVVDGCVGVPTAHGLDEGGREVVVLVTLAVVEEGPLAGGVDDVAFGDRLALRARRVLRELEDLERAPRVTAGAGGDERDELVRELGVERGGPAAYDLPQRLLVERDELDHGAAREERRVHLEVRVLGRRADQRDEAVLDRVQHRVLLRLVEAVDLVDEEDRAAAVSSQPVPCARHHRADIVHPRGHGRQLLEGGSGRLRDDARERGLPDARRAVDDERGQAVLGDSEPKRGALTEYVLLAHQLVECARPKPRRQRRVRGLQLLRGVGEEVSHAAKYAPGMAAHEAQEPGPGTEDFSEPILPGGGASDYERYLNTDGLLALQKGPDEWVHRDELLFQVTHQSSELWLKLSWNDAEEAARLLEEGDLRGALRLLKRASLCIRFLIPQLEMLEHMSPWEYQEIRQVLGHGSGFDSPGWNELRRIFPRLGQAFHAARRKAGLSLTELYVHGRDHEHLYQLAEALIELDEQAQLWRMRHYQVVARVIGDSVVGTQGTPVELLGRLVTKTSFPELWEVRNELTALSKASP